MNTANSSFTQQSGKPLSLQYHCEIAAKQEPIQNAGSVRISLKYLKPILKEDFNH